METREQLLEQYADWIAKYNSANEWLGGLLPRKDSSELEVWVPTKESLSDMEKVKRDVNRALDQLHRIMQKLWELR